MNWRTVGPNSEFYSDTMRLWVLRRSKVPDFEQQPN